MIDRLKQRLQPLWRRQPMLRSRALDAIDFVVRPIFWPFRSSRPASDQARATSIESRAEALNVAAEQYYQAADAEHLTGRPFSEPDALSRRLIDVGILIEGMRLRPGDRVLELGAGTAWFSHLLNKYGCRTIAVDVSPTALALGRGEFERDPRTKWDLHPEFLSYDGHTLPVADGSIDRVLLYDAYHHLPNPNQLLKEMRRVLTADGIVAMSEPGRGHTESASSHAEAATGVLENELVLEEIAEAALAAGFHGARVVVASNRPLAEVDAHELRGFMGGRGFARYWKQLCAELDGHHYLLLFAGDPAITTRRAKTLRAVISGPPVVLKLHAGTPTTLALNLFNAGDTTWLHGERVPGWTRFGAHLYRADQSRTVVSYDWLRVALPCDVAPEQSVTLMASLPAINEPGDYELEFDLVVEGETWFGNRGSMPLMIQCRVMES